MEYIAISSTMLEITLRHDEFVKLSSEILEIGGSFSFQAHGASMYPFICGGDVLTVKQVEYSALKVGDIAFYRSYDDRLIVHRIVDKKLQSNKLMLLMRGDSVFNNDGWIYSDQVLGKVVSIQQDKKFIQLDQRGLLRSIMYSWNKLYPLGPFSFHLTLKGKR